MPERTRSKTYNESKTHSRKEGKKRKKYMRDDNNVNRIGSRVAEYQQQK